MKRIYFLLIFVFANSAFALYDFAAINLTPNNDQVSFCLEYDTQKWEFSEKLYRADNLYIAAVTKPAGEVLFVEPTTNGFSVIPLRPNNEVPIFSQWRSNSEPICLGPFAKPALEDISIYAGIGNSLEEVMQRNSIVKFFDGFPDLPAPETAWTVMVYLVGSDLEAKPNRKQGKHWASKDILEMLAGTALPNSTTNLVITTGGSTRNGWNTVKRAFLQNGHQYVLEDLGEQNMSNPQTLSDFVVWAKTQFPAQHYALILWNHGGGTQGYGKDTSPAGNGAMMSLNQLHQAYQTIRQSLKTPLDIVVYDACLMATIEVAHITATLANAMASSVELEPAHGIDYAHLLNNLNTSPPADGLAFGSIVKNGYLEHTKNQGTFDPSQITYSVFDLTQLPAFTETFRVFAEEFQKLLKKKDFLNYQSLSQGIIRAPGYPLKATGRLRFLRSVTGSQPIRIDLYNILQTVGPEFDNFSESATTLLNILDNMIVDYATNDNVQQIHPDAGRISIDFNITNPAHLSALPEAYTLFNQGLAYYDERRQEDGFIPNGPKNCFLKGMHCLFAQWLELVASDILGIEAYFGQTEEDIATVYLVDRDFYQYRELTETLKLGVDGHQACQYQLCVSENQCEDITLTKQGKQLLADISLNDSPSVLSFCNKNDKWSVCGVAQQIDGIWGRDDLLYTKDNIIPSTLQVQGNETEQRQGNPLIVDEPMNVSLQKNCEEQKAAIWAMYYGSNQQNQMELLCDKGDCICQPDDTDRGCQEIGFKAGVSLE